MTWLLTALLWLAVVGLLAAGLWWAYRRPPTVLLTREVPPNGFQGTRLSLTLRLHLSSRLPVRYLVEDPPPRTVVPDTAPALAGELLGQETRELRTVLSLNSRGVYPWPGARLHWADPLGLFWRSVPLGEAHHLEVFPTTHGLRLPELLRPLLSEGALSRQLGLDDPISLRSVRDYVPGDPPGRIHWRSSARTGTLSVREPERTAASSVTVYLDVSGGGEVFAESAARLAASLLQEALALELPVSVATNAGATAPGRHAEALHAALLALARLEPDAASPVIPPVRSGGNLIILTARPSPALIAGAMRARATASRVAVVAMPEGFYLEPGERPRRQWVAAPDAVRALEQQAGVLAGAGILVFVLRGNQSVLRLGG
ncbi:DUF58 domain-containing protein [Deinococcus aerophilus]|uniref:DUF58 domain-containing protein n=1 Tax=Deinococcus aerophilus TaxID=522488 RepID=A0ABQ2GWQ4_9DEIO|nr:DUF58 domain-containing protein [Deinococcus aerophilus]GGM15466.1 hypothetical protein GCM10010841_24900 [Deinococcus aerophilus]